MSVSHFHFLPSLSRDSPCRSTPADRLDPLKRVFSQQLLGFLYPSAEACVTGRPDGKPELRGCSGPTRNRADSFQKVTAALLLSLSFSLASTVNPLRACSSRHVRTGPAFIILNNIPAVEALRKPPRLADLYLLSWPRQDTLCGEFGL